MDGCRTKAASLFLTLNTMALSVMATYSGDLFEVAESASESVMTKLLSLAKVLFPLALIILFISILFTKDQRALSTEIKLAVTICIVYALILLVGNNTVRNTVTDLIGADAGSPVTTIKANAEMLMSRRC